MKFMVLVAISHMFFVKILYEILMLYLTLAKMVKTVLDAQ